MEAGTAGGGGRIALVRAPGTVAEPAARQSFLREYNLSLVLRRIVDSPRPLSRAQLAKETGLTRATVSALVDRLVAARLVQERIPKSAKHAGRPAVPLVPASKGIVGMGLSVQVDHIGVLGLDLAGGTVAERVITGNFRASDPHAVIERLSELADQVSRDLVKQGAVPAGIAVSVPGLVQDGRLVRYAPNLDWHDIDVAALLGASLGGDLPITVGNDADLGARAESRARARRLGIARAEQSFLYIECEVGIGGAVVVRGELAEGRHGWGGEVGHMAVDRSGPPCGCGARGCLEQYAGKDTMLTRAGLGLGASMGDLRRLVDAGDRSAQRAVSQAAEGLGTVISSTLNLVDLDTVVLGGTFASIADLLVPTIERHIRRRTLASRWAPIVVQVALEGEHADLIGAAVLVLDEVVGNPSAWVAAG